ERVVAGVSLDLFDFDQGREHLPDLLGHRRQAVDVLLDARPLAPAIPLDELLGQLVEPAEVARTEFRRHPQGPSPLPGIVADGAASQSFRVRSSQTEASVRPSGLNAMFRIYPECPLRISKVCLLAGSQRRMVLSQADEASRPSGLNVRPRTSEVCPS